MISHEDLQKALDQEDNTVPCQNAPDLFFPPDKIYEEKISVNYSMAKSLCATCPIVEVCLSYALDNKIADGVWGGLAPRQREAMLRVRKLKSA